MAKSQLRQSCRFRSRNLPWDDPVTGPGSSAPLSGQSGTCVLAVGCAAGAEDDAECGEEEPGRDEAVRNGIPRPDRLEEGEKRDCEQHGSYSAADPGS